MNEQWIVLAALATIVFIIILAVVTGATVGR